MSGRKSVILIHNLHTFRDKAFLDQLFDLNLLKNIESPVICIFNKLLISERLISHICKKCLAIYILPNSFDELKSILIQYHKKHNFDESILTDRFIQDSVSSCQGNIHKLFILWKYFILNYGTRHEPIHDEFINRDHQYQEPYQEDQENSKSLICSFFDILCKKDVPFYKKIDTIKIYGSLLKLLMNTHICSGLMILDMPHSDRLKMCIHLMKYLSMGDTIKGIFNINFSHILQCIIPTYLVNVITIKSLILPSFPSTSYNQIVRIRPHHPDQALFISLFMIKYFLCVFDYNVKKKNIQESQLLLNSMNKWRTVIESFDKEFIHEINLKFFKLFPQYIISKKKSNKFFKTFINT